MARYVSVSQHNFTSGELSPRLHYRSDLEKYVAGLRQCVNMIVQRQGGVTRRPGTRHVVEPKDNGFARLIPFRRSSSTNLVLEMGANYIRFFEGGTQLKQGGSPIELATPYAENEVDEVRFDQTGDVMYLFHPKHAPQKLSRTAATVFTLTAAVNKGGPFLTENFDETKTIRASAATGTVTLTSSGFNAFTQNHVGSVWRLRWQDRSGYGKWQGQSNFTAAASAISRGKAYKNQTTGTSGVNAPDHTEGIEWDGAKESSDAEKRGLQWQYLHSGYADLRVISYISPTQVVAEIDSKSEIPLDVVNPGTKYWSEPAWSDERGWPATGAFFNDRLVYAIFNELYFSQNGDFENLSPTDEHGDIITTSALRFVISDAQANNIRWIKQVGTDLIVGTTGSEFAIGPQTPNEPFGPDNVRANPYSWNGTADFVQPARADQALLYVARNCRSLYEFSSVDSGYVSSELTILADHMLYDCAFETDFQRSPEPVLWAITNKGGLVAVTYEPKQEVVAWHRHTLGGTDPFVESLAVVPSVTEEYDEIWLIVARSVDGSVKRSIEFMGRPFQDVLDVREAEFLDAAFKYKGTLLDTFTLAHLPNTAVTAVADGRVIEGLTTSAQGVVTLPEPATDVIIGLHADAYIETLSPDPGSLVGSSTGKTQRINKAYVILRDTNLCEAGVDPSNLYTVDLALGDQIMTDPVPLFSGIKEVDISADYQRAPTLWIRQRYPLPLTVAGVQWDDTVANH